jgi:hypothetical protein
VEYWSENPGRWPTDNLLVGQFTFTKQDTLPLILNDTQDLAARLQWQFIAAALNLLNGADSSAVEATMVQASAWIDAHPPLIDLDADERQEGEMLVKSLEDYNRGLTGPGLCADNLPLVLLSSPPAPTATEAAPVLKIASLPIVKATPAASPENKRAQGSGRRPHTHSQDSGSPDVNVPEPGPTPNPPIASAPASASQSQPLADVGGSEQPVQAPEGQPEPTAIAIAPANQPVSASAPAETPKKEPKLEKEPKPPKEPKSQDKPKKHEKGSKPPKEPKPQEQPISQEQPIPQAQPKPPEEPKPPKEAKPQEQPKPPKEAKPPKEPKPPKEAKP